MKYIYSWNPHSKGARSLAGELGWPRVRHEGSRFRGRPQKLVVNWGSTEVPAEVLRCKVINHPEQVSTAANKLATYFAIMDKPYCPWFTCEIGLAGSWMMEEEGAKILCRTVLNGHSGQGIHIATTPAELIAAPLYVEYVPKKEEYRVHILGERVFVQQKKKREDAEVVDWRVRNHANGFVYARNDIAPPEAIVRAARDAVNTLGLHFGAVDIGWNVKHQRATVYEVNTAPGLEGTTVHEYVAFMRSL